jgi:amino acid adenylation domain-containing protein
MIKQDTRKFDLLARVADWTRGRPNVVALDDGARQISYRQLDEWALATKNLLQAAGCRSGDRVAVLIEDRPTLVSVMLGIFRSGAVFAPLEIDASDERVRKTLNQLQARFLIHSEVTKEGAHRHADAVAFRCVPLLAPEFEVAPTALDDGQERGAGWDAAYIYFTSGSTAEPKGIVGSLEALGARIFWEIESLALDPGRRVSQLITPTFDPWFRDVFIPLCSGGTLCFPPLQPARLEPERLLEWLRDAGISVMHCGPTLMNTLVSAPARIRRLPDLQTVLTSGETLHVSLVAHWQRRFGRQVEIINLYGATEATMIQFFYRVKPDDVDRDFIPIGSPLPSIEVRLVDEDGRSCRPGEQGEILVGGDSLSLGYWNDKAATERTFIRLRDGDDTVFYCTGDVGIELEPGCFRLLGRLDDQVKIRGVRVEPGAVEDALGGYPLVAACAVAVRHDADLEPSLVAYVVPETEYPPAVPEMRAYLMKKVPTEFLPSAFVILKYLPLSSNGKIDRSQLPDPSDAPSLPMQISAPPRNAVESMLAKWWAEVLGLPAVGIHDDFLELGGHSLSATRLTARLHAAGYTEIQLRDVFDYRTVAAQAALLQTRAAGSSNPAPGAREPTEVDYDPGTPFAASAPLFDIHARPDSFECPSTPSPLFGRRRCNLVMVLGTDDDLDSFERVAEAVGKFDPSITASVVYDALGWEKGLAPQPTLVFSPALLRYRPDSKMCICCGYPLAKSEEYEKLAKAGVPVPRWVTLEEGKMPDLNGFGRYVVRKPDYGAKGAEIRIVRQDRVRWKPVVTSAAGPSQRLLVQEFVYTGLWPVSYRVNTLFGRVLYAMVITGNKARPTLKGPEDFDARGAGDQSVSIVSNARDSTAELCMDHDVIRFGERAARAFPDLPMLGVDVLRDAQTGALMVTEVNALGHNWNFTPEFEATFRLDITRQFDGLRKAAYILAEEAQLRAVRGEFLTMRPLGC